MNRKNRLALMLLFAIAVATWRIVRVKHSNPVLPPVDRVKSMSTVLHGISGDIPEDLKFTNEIKIPEKYYPFLLKLLQAENKVDLDCKQFSQICDIIVIDDSGNLQKLLVFDVGVDRVTYVTNGSVYKRSGEYRCTDPVDKAGRYQDEALLLYSLLRLICTKRDEGGEVRLIQDLLAKSAGLRYYSGMNAKH